MSGICSIDRRWYEKTPRIMIAAIIMVANTGLLIETRVNHMSVPSLGSPGFSRPAWRRTSRLPSHPA